MTRQEALVLARMATARTRAERFWAKASKGDGCWEWAGVRNPQGYGRLSSGPRGRQVQELAHRVSWEVTNGRIPDGMLVCHHCDNPPCVRPDHLFLGTNADNIADSAQKGRMHRGESHGMAKLTEADVLAIRSTPGLQREVAAAYGIDQSAVSLIRNRKVWGWLP